MVLTLGGRQSRWWCEETGLALEEKLNEVLRLRLVTRCAPRLTSRPPIRTRSPQGSDTSFTHTGGHETWIKITASCPTVIFKRVRVLKTFEPRFHLYATAAGVEDFLALRPFHEWIEPLRASVVSYSTHRKDTTMSLSTMSLISGHRRCTTVHCSKEKRRMSL